MPAPSSYVDGEGNTIITAYESKYYEVFLYNFYTGLAGSSLREYYVKDKRDEDYASGQTVKSDGFRLFYENKDDTSGDKNVPIPDKEDNEFYFNFKIDANNFEFKTAESDLALYDGKNYVAHIYKNAGQACGSLNDLNNVAIKILYNDKTYYNITTQNVFADEASMKSHYDSLQKSFVIGFVRDYDKCTFSPFFDFNFWPLDCIRFNWALIAKVNNKENVNNYFDLADGIQFDYFFDDHIKLNTFYKPSAISYWVIILASALIIKVLGTAIWGVIKRFYEITLYYLAAPPLASLMPVSEDKFNNLQKSLISKVLSTYGIILGLNVFFILLQPIESITDNIFTAEDIAVSGSYFLKHWPFGVDILNNYVYILFILVAFTMIEALPQMISKLIGTDNIVDEGAKTKKAAMKAVSDAGDFVSGKSLIEGGKKLASTVTGAIPGGALVKGAVGLGKKGYEWGKSKFGKGAAEGEKENGGGGGGDTSEGGEKPRNPEEENPETTNTGTPVNQVENAREEAQKTTGKTDEEVIRNGTSVDTAVQEAVKDMQLEEVEDSDENDEAIAENEFNKNALNNTEIVGDDKNAAIANTVRNNVDVGAIVQAVLQALGNAGQKMTGNTDDKKGNINAALFGVAGENGQPGQAGLVSNEAKLDAIRSTMSDDEREAFDKQFVGGDGNPLEGEELQKAQEKALAGYEFKAEQGDDGSIAVSVAKKDENGNVGEYQTVDKDASNAMISDAMQHMGDEEIGVAVKQADAANSVQGLLAQNLANAISIGADGSTDDLTENVLGHVVNGEGQKEQELVAQAILANMKSGNGAMSYEAFAAKYGISEGDDARAVATIMSHMKSKENSDIYKAYSNPESYKTELVGVIKDEAKAGSYVITAAEIKKAGDAEGFSKYVEEVKAERVQNAENNILKGASNAEGIDILNNTARAIIENDPNSAIAKQIQNQVFASNLTEEDIANNEEAIKRITGVSNVKDLTDEQKAMLGFIKAKNGGFVGADGAPLQMQEVESLKKAFGNSETRNAVYNEKFTDIERAKVFADTGMSDLLVRVASKDSTLAVDGEKLVEAEAAFVKGMSDDSAEKQEIARMYKNATGSDLKDASDEQVAAFLAQNKQASNLVIGTMKEQGYNFEALANSHYEHRIARN